MEQFRAFFILKIRSNIGNPHSYVLPLHSQNKKGNNIYY
jgi:hypothetical protein